MKYLHVLSLIALSFATLSMLYRITGNTTPANATLISAPAFMMGPEKDQETGLLIGE
jgi:membrane protein CcdC involved in cytochrome C biogenesis